MKLNDKYCELLDADFGYDNQSLADKIEKTSDKFAIGFLDSIREYERENGSRICFDERDSKELLLIYKNQKVYENKSNKAV